MLWDVHVYKQTREGQLPMDFLMGGQVEALDKHRACIKIFKQVREIYGKDLKVEMVITRR
jgi:hypothetical protein